MISYPYRSRDLTVRSICRLVSTPMPVHDPREMCEIHVRVRMSWNFLEGLTAATS